MFAKPEKRKKNAAHLSRVRLLPCISCGSYPPNEAAHIRIIGTGMGRRPDDDMALPLCSECHRTGPHAEHNTGGSTKCYDRLGIDPIDIAEQLIAAKDVNKMIAIVMQAKHGDVL